MFVYIQAHVIIPLLPLMFPVMWIVINCFGTARIKVLFKTEISQVCTMAHTVRKLILVSSCSNTGSIRDDPYWTSRENSLELIELSSINKVCLV